MRFEGNWAYLDATERTLTGLPNRVILSNKDNIVRYEHALERQEKLEQVVEQSDHFHPDDRYEAYIALERCDERVAIMGEIVSQGCVNAIQQYLRTHYPPNPIRE